MNVGTSIKGEYVSYDNLLDQTFGELLNFRKKVQKMKMTVQVTNTF